jgi:hypothetical protein
MSWLDDNNDRRDRHTPPPHGGVPRQEGWVGRPPWELPDQGDRVDLSRQSWDREQFERRSGRDLAEQEPRRTNWFLRGFIAVVIAAALVWLFLELGGSILSTRYSGF